MQDFSYISRDVVRGNELVYHINRAGISRVDVNFDIERNSSYPYCVLHYVTEGTGFIICRGKQYAVNKGQLFLLNAHEPHRYWTNLCNPFTLQWIEFSGSDCSRFIASVLDRCSPVMNAPVSKAVQRYMLRIFSFLSKGPENKATLISKLLYSIFLTLLEASNVSKFEEEGKSRIAAVQDTVSYIDSHINEALSVEQLARHANFCPEHFSRLFNKITGFTPAKYILQKRISKSKEMLSTCDIQIEILAEKLGFCNASHFIRLFKKAEGLTPAEFRRQSMHYRRKGG